MKLVSNEEDGAGYRSRSHEIEGIVCNDMII